MKIIRYTAVFLSMLMLFSCGKTEKEDDNNSKSSGISDVSKAETEKLLYFPEFMDEPSVADGYKFTGWCEVWDEEYKIRTDYRGTLENDDINEIWDFVCSLPDSEYEQVKGNYDEEEFAVTLKEKSSGINLRISSCGVEDYTDPEDIRFLPAIRLTYGDDYYTYYIVPDRVRKEFEEIIKSSTAKEENIHDVYERPGYSYTEITDHEYKKDLIVFVDSYSNAAWGIQNHGTFIDSNGYVYEYNFDGRNLIEEYMERNKTDSTEYDDAFVDALYYEVYYKNQPYAKTDEHTVVDCIFYKYGIDPDSEFEQNYGGSADMGQDTLYIVDIDSTDDMLFKLRTNGDLNGILNDEYAKMMIDIYDSLEYEFLDK